jgi:branched-chain amino acid transport system substrate-binding protein
MKKRLSSMLLALALLLALFAGCAPADGGGETTPTPGGTEQTPGGSVEAAAGKDKIVIGGVRSQSGVYALFDETAFGPIYRMWAAEVNADGGIYVEEYGKKLPVELIIYDDKSEMDTMTRLYEKLILEDKVDLLLPPVSTAALFAAAQIANQHDYLLIGAEGAAVSIKENIEDYPGFFCTLNFSDTQVPALTEVLTEGGIESVFIVYIEDLHGMEYSQAAVPAFEAAGIEIKDNVSVPPDIGDMTPIINSAKNSGAQAFLMFAYPDQNFLAVSQAKELGYNPDVFFIGSGGSFDSCKLALGGDEGVEGIMTWGAWNEKSSDAAAEFARRFREFNAGDGTVFADWWGHLPYYVSVQVLQQAIERAGTLDNKVLREYIAENKFDTVMGEAWFENHMLAAECYLGNVGQWQSGVYEVIDVGGGRTAPPIIPKPAWK